MLPASLDIELAMLQTSYGHGIRGQFTKEDNSRVETRRYYFRFTTLEHSELVVELSDRGYKIIEMKQLDSSVESECSIGDCYESMDALLSTISEGYRRSFQMQLHAQLEALNDRAFQ
ncbi:hypothetical protein BDF22DRAFT_744080 [Syncephalis plumigaleata]|nr:hypothetical protein BDF22DRAFT_744080 [Syncephalis plumigaleata]